MELLAVFLGGGLGSVSRYALGKIVNEAWPTLFPLGTLAVNALGCLVIGFLYALFDKQLAPSGMRLFLMTGFLGGFTTFSTFGLESVTLARSGDMPIALLNILISIILGLGLVILGMLAAGLLFKNR
ncbi:MAG TPA: fluoride efflux transporter CrcB [Spirochaetota bacterium]|nr:fluoride efflux transporter CrcB [Spirochaetota bacterium]